MVNRFEDLEIYKRSEQLSDQIWEAVGRWENFEKFSIGVQITKSADSISANIAEGFGRFHFKENKQFCYYSRGSLHETKAWVSKCIRRKLIPEPEGLKMQNELDEIGRMLNAYIKTIGL